MKTAILQYINEHLGEKPVVLPMEQPINLPLLLTRCYEIVQVKFGSQPFTLMIDRRLLKLTPSEIERHCEIARRILGLPIVYAIDSLPSYQRERLLNKRVNFIVPQKQLYLPFLGVVINDKARRSNEPPERLSVYAQIIALLFLNNRIENECGLSDLESILQCSRQTVYNALNELENLGLLTRINIGKIKRIHFLEEKQEFFKGVFPYIVNPVKKIIGIESLSPLSEIAVLAGESLLSQRTMLSEPEQQEWAITVSQFQQLKKELKIVPLKDALFRLQLWRYNPVLPKLKEIDNISLYLSLQNNPDERIQIALSELQGITTNVQ